MTRTALPVLLILLISGPASAGDLFRLSSGLDMSYLDWEHGHQLSWGFQTAFGIRLADDLYLSAKATIPAPTFVIIGNQVCVGGEISYLPLSPDEGFALRTSIGISRCWMWPEHFIVILADGETTEPPPSYDFENADGVRFESLLSVGHKWRDLAIWLDLGLDHRVLEVERLVNNHKVDGDFDFTGVHTGFSLELYL
jgi:hypothetical protein